MIIVTGATGKLGSLVVEQLLARVPAAQVGVSVRDPVKARHLEERGVRVRRGDFTDPASLAAAFEGASQILLVSAGTTGEGAVRQHRTAIEAAVAAGAGRILYTSHMGADPTSPFAPMPDHAATETLLRDCGVAFTALRNGFYASTVDLLLGPSGALATGELAVPEDGPVAWTTHADLAEATAIALTGGGLEGLTPALTAAEAVDMEGVAALASELTGRPVRRMVVTDADYRAGLVSHGVPEAAADILVGMFRAARRSDFAATDPTLAGLLGRRPASLREALEPGLTPAR
jgi:NAD(P)H dehydrogenase (quinone)